MKQLSLDDFLIMSTWEEIKDKCKIAAPKLGYRECARQLGISIGSFQRIIKDQPVRPSTIKKCIEAYVKWEESKNESI